MKDVRKITTAALVTLLFALALMVILGKFPGVWTSSTADTSWDSRAILARFAGVKVREVDASNADLIFSFDLDNTTDSDYKLTKGPNAVIMSHLKSDGSFSSEQQINLNSSIFIPARNRTRIALDITRPFDWPSQPDAASDAKFRQLVAGQVADLEGFVLFDQTARYQINLPGGWSEPRQISEAVANR